MLQEKASVYFVPWGDGDVERHIATGAAWLRKQPGDKAVFVPGKQNYGYNKSLPRLTAGAAVLTERNFYQTSWRKGPLLACWPTERMFGTISDRLNGRITTVCVLEWGDAPYQRSWVSAHGGIDLTTGQATARGQNKLEPVVLAAMEDMSSLVNHSNGLVGTFDKAIAVSILQTLVQGGYQYGVDHLCSWALANGFTASEVESLRDYATKALKGHRFRQHHNPLRPDLLQHWERKAQLGKQEAAANLQT